MNCTPLEELPAGGRKLRSLRLEAGLTIAELAQRAGVCAKTVEKWERYGPRSISRPSAFRRLCEAIGGDYDLVSGIVLQAAGWITEPQFLKLIGASETLGDGDDLSSEPREG